MWCTRWFLPLLLLPLPTAPPYFLLLFLFSLGLHAKPCFYCVILLAALFLSSCYWQSFPLDTPLSVSWSENITTFSEALNSTMTPSFNVQNVQPPIIRVLDRCWCDFSGSMFEPYDMEKWERASVERMKADVERAIMVNYEDGSPKVERELQGNIDATADGNGVQQEHIPQGKPSFFILRSIFGRNKSLEVAQVQSSLPISELSPAPSDTTTPAAPTLHVSLEDKPIEPGEYDLRPYGFDLVFDLRWSRRP
ncbi:hypothetical protein SERLA73DRAFT_176227 [Serpula lacrymans var. lacrymans S7.3]|uniref:Uncharacterized protein n=2 Tax=Serpula lacrymans var. lacrymans TaxID=341189 RepID=F8PMJ3_SERL3|nr:uncharacterized protein SERLADRAFT_459023 [Serpula lacrymans var. lacrymans S7.9]EGO02825.1 hypothetical protein SERLA73DRAFT_176227 [Serpula lacrymans var. lacrymans S7.3]EGO28523.1 hypothetical protein SERLADRAFT_459023 [Serpula lacrymans var. lacrymans S7.9]